MAGTPKFEMEYHTEPRISANELARFMLAKDPGKLGIIRRARQKRSAGSIRYSDARSVIRNALRDPVNEARKLHEARERFEQRAADASLKPFTREDAEKSVEVLDALTRMRNLYAGTDFQGAPQRQPKLNISGVAVSVESDLLIHGRGRQEGQVGGALLRLAQPEDEETEGAKRKRESIGAYAATLVFMHVRQNLAGNLQPRAPLCWSIDVQNMDVYKAPARTAGRVAELEAACTMISGLWDRV